MTIKTITLGAAAAISALTALPAAAEAQRYDGYYDRGYSQRDYRQDQRQQRRAERQYYRQQQRYDQQRYYDDRDYGRRCNSGATGTIVGAVAGGLLGREVVGRYGDRTAGTIVGGAAGALLGRAIGKNC